MFATIQCVCHAMERARELHIYFSAAKKVMSAIELCTVAVFVYIVTHYITKYFYANFLVHVHLKLGKLNFNGFFLCWKSCSNVWCVYWRRCHKILRPFRSLKINAHIFTCYFEFCLFLFFIVFHKFKMSEVMPCVQEWLSSISYCEPYSKHKSTKKL